MSIINQIDFTKLRSIRFGNDRPDQGSSNQPYIQTSIPKKNIGTGGTDFLLRGGILSPKSIEDDVTRMTKMMFDIKSPNGLLFTIKQNILSLSDVNTRAPLIDNPISVNKRIYSPTSTITQTALTPLGYHISKQGLVPINTLNGNLFNSFDYTNRLETLYRDKIINFSSGDILYSYSGGPGSFLGIGKTNIKLSTFRTGINNRMLDDYYTPRQSREDILTQNNEYPNPNLNYETRIYDDETNRLGVTYKYDYFVEGFINSLKNEDFFDNRGTAKSSIPLSGSLANPVTNNINFLSTYPSRTLFLNNGQYNKDIKLLRNRKADLEFRTQASNYYNALIDSGSFKTLEQDFTETTLDENPVHQAKSSVEHDPGDIIKLTYEASLSYNQIIEQSKSSSSFGIREDFRKKLGDKYKNKSNTSYIDSNYEKRTNYGLTSGGSINEAYDKINALDIYKSNNVTEDLNQVNDLVKFRIAVIDNDKLSESYYMHFRAYLDSFSDSYNAGWDSMNYVGRGEKFYRYNSFERSISLSWTVVAQSKAELAPMYRKLNFLASHLTPNYSSNGYMRGNLVKMTIGGYIYEQPGIITSLTYDVPTEATWEIGLPYMNDVSGVKELPHIIKVTNVKFIPIHEFVPELYNGTQKYIALTNGNDSSKDLYNNFTILNK